MGVLARACLRALTGAALVASALLAGPVAHAGAVDHPRVVQEQPSNRTPHVTEGAVNAFAQIGGTMFAGGEFTTAQNPARTQSFRRSNIMAFDVRTGAVSSFAPQVNGPVWALEPAADGSALYVAGRFTRVDGLPVRGLFKWDLRTNRVDRAFNPTVTGGRVSDVQLVRGRLFAAGTFPKRLAALDPTTGADTGYLNLSITGDLGRSDDGWQTQVYRFAVDRGQARMVVIGNFTSIQGQRRQQIALIDLGTGPRLSTWYSPRWNEPCHPSTPWYTRDIDWSPDGSYFVVVTTGAAAPNTPKLCDTTSKWRLSASSRAQPDWVNHTGGNTLHSVAVTSAAVYVGGHQQWLDNPQGNKTKGPGAVDRPGIGAIHPTTGRALPWNPTRSRGQGAKDLYITPDGMWVGSDTDRFAHQYRGRIAFVPL